jgi:hypothetical protein
MGSQIRLKHFSFKVFPSAFSRNRFPGSAFYPAIVFNEGGSFGDGDSLPFLTAYSRNPFSLFSNYKHHAREICLLSIYTQKSWKAGISRLSIAMWIYEAV